MYKFKPEIEQHLKNGLSIKEINFAYLIAGGVHPEDAYVISLGNMGTTRKEAASMANTLTASDLSILIDQIREANAPKPEPPKTPEVEIEIDQEQIEDGTFKQEFIRDIIKARELLDKGSKEYLEYSKMIAALLRIKNENAEEISKTTHYYLPLTCKSCRLYKDAKAKNTRTPIPSESLLKGEDPISETTHQIGE